MKQFTKEEKEMIKKTRLIMNQIGIRLTKSYFKKELCMEEEDFKDIDFKQFKLEYMYLLNKYDMDEIWYKAGWDFSYNQIIVEETTYFQAVVRGSL